MLRKFNFAPLEYYHIYNRGTDKRQIFLEHRDYVRFLAALYVGNNKNLIHLSDWQGPSLEDIFHSIKINRENQLVDIGAYCLMPNHFHFLVREKEKEGISTLMRKLQTGYSMYINKKYQRTGNLFESRFKAQHVDNDPYLKYLFAYVHLNPIKTTDPDDWERKVIRNKNQAREFLSRYDYSSYHHFINQPKPHNIILSPSAFPQYFQTKADNFDQFIDDWINFDDENIHGKDGP
jgi:putative transposase